MTNNSNARPTLVIADDHAIVRQGYADLLTGWQGIEIVAEADNGLAAISAVKQYKPTLLILDAAMPMARGTEVFAEVARWSPETKVVVCTGFTSHNFLADWMSAGVDGLVLKSCSSQEIRQAISTVLSGSPYVAEKVRQILADGVGVTALTAREREVLALLANGQINSEIATRLGISPKTVEKHRANLMSKLEVHSLAELLVVALKEGLLDEHKQL